MCRLGETIPKRRRPRGARTGSPTGAGFTSRPQTAGHRFAVAWYGKCFRDPAAPLPRASGGNGRRSYFIIMFKFGAGPANLSQGHITPPLRAPVVLMPAIRKAGLAGALFLMGSLCRGANTPVTVQLDWIANVQFAGVLVAKDKGWYQESGLDVTVRQIDLKAMTTSVGPVLKGTNMIGIADGLVLLNARADHKPVKAFATMLQASPLCILVLRDGPIRSFRDLAGKTIGLHSYDHVQLKLMLAYNHLSESDISALDIGDDLTSLISHKIDAQVAYSIDEKVAIELKGYPTVAFPGYENGFVTYSQVYYTTEAFLGKDPKVLVNFMEATNRGWREAFAHPGDAAKMVVSTYMKDGDVPYQEKSLVELKHFATLESDKLGSMRMSTWEKSCQVFKLPPSLAGELVDLSIVDQLK
jgi:NitT/TauT family transport system substrate-binding protein